MAIDYSTPEGKVRLLIADLDEASPMVADTMITGYLDLHGGSVYRAAASVLDAMATSEVMLSKVIKTQDVSADGAKVAAELRAQANNLRIRAGEQEAIDSGEEDSFFTFVPFYPEGHQEGEEYRAFP